MPRLRNFRPRPFLSCIRGHLFCSFLALLLRKEPDDRLRNTLTPATDSEGVRKAAEELAGLRAAR